MASQQAQQPPQLPENGEGSGVNTGKLNLLLCSQRFDLTDNFMKRNEPDSSSRYILHRNQSTCRSVIRSRCLERRSEVAPREMG
jgi:hypothetical protein